MIALELEYCQKMLNYSVAASPPPILVPSLIRRFIITVMHICSVAIVSFPLSLIQLMILVLTWSNAFSG